jgi:hypothetical protein
MASHGAIASHDAAPPSALRLPGGRGTGAG